MRPRISPLFVYVMPKSSTVSGPMRSACTASWLRGKSAGQLAIRLMRTDLVIPDELGDMPFSQLGRSLLFNLISKRYERANLMTTTNLNGSEWANLVGALKLGTELPGQTADRFYSDPKYSKYLARAL